MLKVEQTSTNDTFTMSESEGSATVDMTLTAPDGGRVLSGGFSLQEISGSSQPTLNIQKFGPTSDSTGWEVSGLLSSGLGDEVEVTVYATYVQID